MTRSLTEWEPLVSEKSSNALKERIASNQAERLEENGTMLIRISGCEYKIEASRLKNYLEHWGEVFFKRWPS